jgi:FAD/FMN-containing dehydrogenase
MANWPDEAEDEQHIAACRDGWRRVEPFTSGYYTNALASDDDSRMRTIYGRNYDRLVDIKTRFDPDNLFRLNANIPPRRTKPA